jgi:replication-associated recombination protein RarA
MFSFTLAPPNSALEAKMMTVKSHIMRAIVEGHYVAEIPGHLSDDQENALKKEGYGVEYRDTKGENITVVSWHLA